MAGGSRVAAAEDAPSGPPVAPPPPKDASPDAKPADPSPAPAADAGKPDKTVEAKKAFEQAEVLREECKWAEAAKAYGKALDGDEARYLAHLHYQEVVIAAGEGSTLAPEYDDIARDRPDDRTMKLHRLRLNPPVLRLEGLAAMRKETPNDPVVMLEEGRAHLALGDAAAARKVLEPAYAAQPDLADVVYLSCEAMRRTGDVAGARARLEGLLKRAPDAYEATLRIARMDLLAGKPAEALAGATAVLAVRPSYVAALLVRSEASSRLGKLEDARAALDVALRVNPAAPEALVASADLTAKGASKEGLEK